MNCVHCTQYYLCTLGYEEVYNLLYSTVEWYGSIDKAYCKVKPFALGIALANT